MPHKSTVLSPKQIKRLRGTRTRKEFAALLSVTSMTVFRWETGRAKPFKFFVEKLNSMKEA